ncbi:sensor histidine kinase [Mucilaginibacter flavidus]|uniref:sensor histidine kinase n=1 Tax=Mucilaginibacter flavidus TaxID=2949309 RepID=UPI0020936138|nr:HAMP domain-containing sensor histidine kinase [Mucilaginibacter flavidus]MCO5946962.1 HAMP domain-containing histidine kinase [Mucilaginibacter flavidus]
MDKYLFKDLTGKHKNAYRDYYTRENLSSVRVGAIIFLVLNVVIRALYLIFPLSLTKAENFPEFDITNWVFMGSALFFYIISNFLIDEINKNKKATAIMSLFVFTFALYIILCGMFSSFIATSNPRNALVLYLISLTVIGVLCVFEYYETIILIIAVELMFTSLLIHAHTDPTEMIYNQMVSIILLGGFYWISRYFFSYKANYWMQVNEIREKNLEIAKASDFKSQLLGTVAHDLRNPIAAVETLAMMMEMEEINADTQDTLNLMKASCIRARTIIDDLLESARNDNSGEFVTIKTELNALVQQNIDVWKLQNEAKNTIELITSINPAYAQINHEKFTRVLDNLIGNALKFSKEKSKIEVFISKRNQNIIIEIKDRGLGIPKDMLTIIFTPFSKAGRTGLKGEQSTGLGLSIVKQIIEKHNGKIEVESEVGKGSTFRVVLPEVRD